MICQPIHASGGTQSADSMTFPVNGEIADSNDREGLCGAVLPLVPISGMPLEVRCGLAISIAGNRLALTIWRIGRIRTFVLASHPERISTMAHRIAHIVDSNSGSDWESRCADAAQLGRP